MTTLTDFLLARIAEDEAMGAASTASGWAPGAGGLYWDDEYGGEICVDPARVLAECEAKRQIVDWALNGPWFAPDRDDVDLPLRLLALPYADHPDYEESWRV